MKKQYLLLLPALLAVSACGSSETGESSESSLITFTETFDDEVLEANVSALLNGFTLSGTITQKRYEVEEDVWGDYQITGDPTETAVYYTNIAFDNSAEENAYYKYSYYIEDGATVTAEGPYSYFEDSNGYAYTETLDYTNTVIKDYSSYYATTADGLTFADNGFYNFFEILIEDDFTLNESITAYTRYDLNINKAAIISNNLLYSLNSGAYCVPTEAYIRADNGTFTQLYINLSPLISYDSLTGDPSGITNEVIFTFSNIGTTSIERLESLEETETSATIDAALDAYEDTSFVLEVYDESETYNTYSYTTTVEESAIRYSFTGSEIFVHHISDDGSADIDYDIDFYLAPASDADQTLWPYFYDEDSGEWVINTGTVYDDDGNVIWAQGYSGAYTYEQYLPIIADLSGVFFEDNGDGTYGVLYDYLDTVKECLLTTRNPFVYDGYEQAYSIDIAIADSGRISIYAPYGYTNSFYGDIVYGEVDAYIYGAGTITLDGIIG